MLRLSVKWDVGRAFSGWCTGRAAGLKNWTQGSIQAGPAMLRALEEHHADVFNTSGGRSGYGPWAGLRPRTLKHRARRSRVSKIAPFDYAASPGGSVGILRWGYRLYRSLATQGNAQGDAIRVIHRTKVIYGTRTPTGLFHAAGRRGRNPMPKRMPLDDLYGPLVAIAVAHSKIMSFLHEEGSGASEPSPSIVRNAAGFYSKR